MLNMTKLIPLQGDPA